MAIFTKHCLEQFTRKVQSPKFKLAIYPFNQSVQPDKLNGSYIMLDLHCTAEFTSIVTDEDGNNRVFDNRDDVEAKASDCQEGLVVEL